LARESYAVGCFDWDLHGQRGAGSSEILDLLVPSSLPSLSSVFQQGVPAEMVFAEALRALAAEPELEGRLAFTHHLYAGVSMGGVMGALATAMDETIDASALNVPGGGIVHLVRHSELFATLGIRDIVRGFVEGAGSVTSLPVDLEGELIIAMSQFALDEADPVNWGSHLVHDRLVEGDPPVLLQQS